ncbi:hypothetical protein BDZ91DRAFT_804307 [Kalaharituber pfeilii]|nr:hypothetical protein BDZ91DRAFT_804307 [Kalaharituber pfeilii]
MSEAEGKRRFERVREVNAEVEATMPIRKSREYAEVFHKHIRSLEGIEFMKKRDKREGERLVKATERPNRVITIEEIQDRTVATQDIIDFIEKSEGMDPFPLEDQIEDLIIVAQYQVNNTHNDGEYIICTPGEDDTYSNSSIRTVTVAPRTVTLDQGGPISP